MITNDIGEGFLSILVLAIAFAVLASDVRSQRYLAIGSAWIGVVVGAIGAAAALCGLVVAAFAIWAGRSGPLVSWEGLGHGQPRHSAMVAIGVALGALVVAFVAAVHGLWSKKKD